MDTPVGDKWWPHPLWGARDEAGSTNWYTRPEVVQRALAEAGTGKVYRLGRPYSSAMPVFGDRKFVLRIPGGPTGGPFGANVAVYNDEFLATEVGQVGTQFDGLGHIGVAINGAADKSEIRYYNGVTQLEIEGSSGLKKLGIEKLHPINARGILLDIAALKGVEAMAAGYEITLADVNAPLAICRGRAGPRGRPSLCRVRPRAPDQVVDHLVHHRHLERLLAHARDALMIDHLAAENHALQQLGVQALVVEPLRRVKRRQRLLSGDGGQDGRGPIDPDIVAVNGNEALQVTGVVGLELARNNGFGTHRRISISSPATPAPRCATKGGNPGSARRQTAPAERRPGPCGAERRLAFARPRWFRWKQPIS